MRLFCPTWTIQKSKLIFVYNKKPAFQRVYFKSAQSVADEPIPQFSQQAPYWVCWRLFKVRPPDLTT